MSSFYDVAVYYRAIIHGFNYSARLIRKDRFRSVKANRVLARTLPSALTATLLPRTIALQRSLEQRDFVCTRMFFFSTNFRYIIFFVTANKKDEAKLTARATVSRRFEFHAAARCAHDTVISQRQFASNRLLAKNLTSEYNKRKF